MAKFIDILIIDRSSNIKYSHRVDYDEKRCHDLKLVCDCIEIETNEPDIKTFIHRENKNTGLILWRGFLRVWKQEDWQKTIPTYYPNALSK